jgi:hypothetical protein
MLAGRVPTRIEASTPISYRDLAVEIDGLLRHDHTAFSTAKVVAEAVPVEA